MGMTLYLVATSIVFAGLVGVFTLMRHRSQAWPPTGAPPLPQLLPALTTLLGVSVALTMRRNVKDLLGARLAKIPRRLSQSGILASLFAFSGAALWLRLAAMDSVEPSALAGLLYLTLSLYGLHVLGGLVLLAWIRRGAAQGRYHARNSTNVRLVTRYWSFLAATWGVIYLLVFLIR